MKYLIYFFTLTVYFTTFAGAAEPDVQTVRSILFETANEMLRLQRDLNIGGIVANSENLVKTIQQETLVSTERSSGSSSYSNSEAGAFLIGWGIGGGVRSKQAYASQSDRVDYTKLIIANPVEIQRAQTSAKENLASLKAQLTDLLKYHSASLLLMKRMALLHIKAANYLAQNDFRIQILDVRKAIAPALEIQFLGTHTVTSCIEERHIDSVARDHKARDGSSHLHASAQLGFGLRGLYAGLTGSNESSSRKFSNYVKRVAHTEEKCSSSVNELKVTQNDSIYKINFTYLDYDLKEQLSALEFVIALNKPTLAYPNWGNTSYTDFNKPKIIKPETVDFPNQQTDM